MLIYIFFHAKVNQFVIINDLFLQNVLKIREDDHMTLQQHPPSEATGGLLCLLALRFVAEYSKD